MDLSLFATQVTQKGQALSGRNSALLGGTGGLGGTLGGVDFWNAILGNLGEIEGEERQKLALNSANDQSAVAQNNVKKETTDLALLQLALLGQDPDVSIDEKLKELRIERIANNPENRIEQLTKLVNHLTSGLPEVASQNNISIEELVTRLNQRLEKLESSLEAFRSGDFGENGAPFQALIATGLNPSQLTNITNRIEEVETKLGRELTIEDLIAGVGNIIPVTKEDKAEFEAADALALLTKKSEEEILQNNETEKEALKESNIADSIDGQAYVDFVQPNFITPADKIGKINKGLADVANLTNPETIASNGATLGALQPTTSQETVGGVLPSTGNVINEITSGRMTNDQFNALFNNGKASQGNVAGVLNGSNNMDVIKNISNLPTLPQTGDISLTSNWIDSLSSSNILNELAGFDIQSGTPFNNVMQAVAHVTAATTQAGQAHPASSMVAAHVSKAAQSGEAKNITLNLDPPELGRVEIRLEFGTEKTVKANLIVEKPETLLLLQRDAGALEKALQDAGLDTSGDSIGYEMASEDYAFNSNREGNSQNGGTGSGENGEMSDEELELIETTMTWDVDPETGHVHYNILA